MRCWVLFRNRSGSTKQGITFAEFKRGLKSYAIDAPERVAREMFNRMDASGDDHIQIKEFIDHVMGRWDPSANVLGGHKSAADIRGASFDRDKVKRLLVKDAVDDTLTVERGSSALRQKIGQRLASGPGGLLRCWVNFRQRAGASKEGITASEWERGLKMYGVPLNKARAKELFDRMDARRWVYSNKRVYRPSDGQMDGRGQYAPGGKRLMKCAGRMARVKDGRRLW